MSRTAERSFVAIDMISPVRLRWNHDTLCVCSTAKSSLRRSNSRRREIAMIVWRMAYLKSPAPTAIANRMSA